MLNSPDTFRPRTKEDYAYEVLRAAILRCELKPGDRLVLDTLSAQLGISPIPMRAALNRLQSDGLVEITPHIGAVVSDLSPASIDQVSFVLERLETMAFELAMGNAAADDIECLRARVATMAALLAAGDTDRWSELNGDFHRAVAELAGNKLLSEFTCRALDAWTRLRRWYLPGVVMQLNQAQAEHAQMIELLAQHNLTELGRLIHDHHERIRELHNRAVAVLPEPHLNHNEHVTSR